MAILNLTPDSFFQSESLDNVQAVVDRAGQMLESGADILDMGGQSTRPGAERITAAEERDRVLPAIAAIHQAFPGATISVDTFYGEVALQATEAGAAIVNDVSAGSIDEELLPAVAQSGAGYILMHMRGSPQDMQDAPEYNNVVEDVQDFFTEKLAILSSMGIDDLMLDPGFGFGKTVEHNYALLKGLDQLKSLHLPLLVGVSRKSMVCKVLGVDPSHALNGSTVLHTLAIMNGANLLRVHDVEEANQVIRIIDAYHGATV